MRKPTNKEKIAQYEALLEDLSKLVQLGNNVEIGKLLHNIDSYSYAHRSGNGELTDKEQNARIYAAFWNLRNR